MTLLLDENLSHRMLPRLRERFPGASHVREQGLQAFDDTEIWRFAKANGYTIVTRDADFIERSVLEGGPPKVIRITTGNTSTASVLHLLEAHASEVATFLDSPDSMILGIPAT